MKRKTIRKVVFTIIICNLLTFLSLSFSDGQIKTDFGQNNANAATSGVNADGKTTYTFDYTGALQSITVSGIVLIECWGAQGGTYNGQGGLGGYTRGELTLQNQTELKIFVGENLNATGNQEGSRNTFGGGGKGGGNNGYPGGGSTDIRINNGTLQDRIMVAGGGGGASGGNGHIEGGSGGNLTGGYTDPGGGYVGESGEPGDQLSGGLGGVSSTPNGENGSLGQGGGGGSGGYWNYDYRNPWPGGGGGGGYYGGGGGSGAPSGSYAYGGGGGGGSSYISGYSGCDNHSSGLIFSNCAMKQGERKGNGLVKITLWDTLPEVMFVSSTQQNLYSTSFPVSFFVNDPDKGDLLTVKYRIDSGAEQTYINTISSDGVKKVINDLSIDIRMLEHGFHKLNLWAIDNKGGTSIPQSIEFMKTGGINVLDISPSSTYADFAFIDSNSGSKKYQITLNDRYLSNTGNLLGSPCWIDKSEFNISNTSITVKGLIPSQKYVLVIKSFDNAGIQIDQSSVIEFRTLSINLPKPEGLKTALGKENISIFWNMVSSATEYEVDADGDITTTSALSFSHIGLQPNTKHIYKVRAKNQESVSEWSTLIKVSTKKALPAVPTNITSSAIGTAISIDWDSVIGATAYQLELDGKTVNTRLKTSYQYTGLKPNTQHTYRVRTIGVDGVSSWSPLKIIYTTDGLITTIPQNILSKATNNTITLNWDIVSDAEAYDIMPILVDGTTGAAIDNGNLTTCDIRGLLPNTTYKYKIRAKNSAGKGPWSEEIQVATYLLDTPQNVTTLKNDTSITFSWDGVLSTDGYELKYYSLVSGITGSGIIVEASTGSSITLTGLTPCTEYKYSLRSKNSQGYSSWREEKSTFTLPQKPGTPENVNATVSDSKITINWIGVVDPTVVGYDVELDGVVLEDGTETVYIHESLEPYSLHTYRVRARNDLVEGDWSPMDNIRTLPAKPVSPKEITVKSTQTGATLSWKAELGASGYDLYVYKLDDNDNEVMVEEINNIEDCTYTHRRQTKGEEYRYRIRTRNIQGISTWGGDIINNAIKAECKKNNTIDLGLTATDVVDFSSYEMVVTYNLGVVEIADLSTLTGKPELTAGKIEGTGITINEFSQGRIVFVVDKAVAPGEAWTGVINGIKFKAKETGGTTITYTVFTKSKG